MLRIHLANVLFILIICLLSITVKAANDNLENDVKRALDLLSEDQDQCKAYTLKLLTKSKKANYSYGLVKSNFILGYLEKKQGDFGKAIIYYLEGIRFAKEADYENSVKDLISLTQNTGHIFKAFGNFPLARKYYSEAMDLAAVNGDFQKYTFLIIQSAKVLREEEKYNEAVTLLETTYSNLHDLKKSTIADIYNQMGLIYSDIGNKQLALANFKKLFELVKYDSLIKTKYYARASHNIGNLYFKLREFESAVKYYQDAVKFKNSMDSPESSLFLSYRDLSESFIKMQVYDSAEYYLRIAEQYYLNSSSISKYYELYKFKAIVKKAKGDFEGYATYQSLYSETLEKHHEEQRQIEASDKKYNLDLITQRYFALVAEQDRNKQIQYYSTIGGSVLVALIVLIISFFQYRKFRLRKDLEASLRPYVRDVL